MLPTTIPQQPQQPRTFRSPGLGSDHHSPITPILTATSKPRHIPFSPSLQEMLGEDGLELLQGATSSQQPQNPPTPLPSQKRGDHPSPLAPPLPSEPSPGHTAPATTALSPHDWEKFRQQQHHLREQQIKLSTQQQILSQQEADLADRQAWLDQQQTRINSFLSTLRQKTRDADEKHNAVVALEHRLRQREEQLLQQERVIESEVKYIVSLSQQMQQQVLEKDVVIDDLCQKNHTLEQDLLQQIQQLQAEKQILLEAHAVREKRGVGDGEKLKSAEREVLECRSQLAALTTEKTALYHKYQQLVYDYEELHQQIEREKKMQQKHNHNKEDNVQQQHQHEKKKQKKTLRYASDNPPHDDNDIQHMDTIDSAQSNNKNNQSTTAASNKNSHPPQHQDSSQDHLAALITLQGQYNDLYNTYTALKQQHAQLTQQYNTQHTNYNALATKYADHIVLYKQLQQTCDVFNDKYDALHDLYIDAQQELVRLKGRGEKPQQHASQPLVAEQHRRQQSQYHQQQKHKQDQQIAAKNQLQKPTAAPSIPPTTSNNNSSLDNSSPLSADGVDTDLSPLLSSTSSAPPSPLFPPKSGPQQKQDNKHKERNPQQEREQQQQHHHDIDLHNPIDQYVFPEPDPHLLIEDPNNITGQYTYHHNIPKQEHNYTKNKAFQRQQQQPLQQPPTTHHKNDPQMTSVHGANNKHITSSSQSRTTTPAPFTSSTTSNFTIGKAGILIGSSDDEDEYILHDIDELMLLEKPVEIDEE